MASTNTMEHNFNEGVSVGQNIAGGPDPVSRWYDAEKVTYEKLIQEHPEYKDLSGYELMQKDEAAYKTVGHYLNIINPKATTIGVGYNTSGKKKPSRRNRRGIPRRAKRDGIRQCNGLAVPHRRGTANFGISTCLKTHLDVRFNSFRLRLVPC